MQWFRGGLVFEAQDNQTVLWIIHAWGIHEIPSQLSGEITALEATQGQIDCFFSQLPYKCHQNRVASVGD